MVELQVIFFGQVQGVFFRATARDMASRMELKGTVQNLPDGSVEVIVHGQQEEVEEFILKLAQQFYLDSKNPYQKRMSEPTRSFEDFQIVY